MAESIALNIDCMEYMATLPDNAFDLAICDPPYGDGKDKAEFREQGVHFHGRGRSAKYSQNVQVEREREQYNRFGNPGGRFDKYKPCIEDGRDMGGEIRKKIIAWDIAPEKEYFDELFRVSRNQIIWGGNYFALPPTRCFLIWRKLTISENFTMAMAEYAWTSFNSNAKVFEAPPQDKARFHPTQKPVALYEWILKHYAKEGDRILDTHLGSGSSRIAAYNLGFDFVGCEIVEVYFDKQEERFAKHTAQTSLFIDGGF